jgi:hypothetical protein
MRTHCQPERSEGIALAFRTFPFASLRVTCVALLLAAACGGPRVIEVRTSPVADTVRPPVAGKPAVPSTHPPAPAFDSAYGKTFLRLSEPAGSFPSENVVSNETSYLHVLDAMRREGVRGGAYIGVGPDQNFSYIAAVRPEVASCSTFAATR